MFCQEMLLSTRHQDKDYQWDSFCQIEEWNACLATTATQLVVLLGMFDKILSFFMGYNSIFSVIIVDSFLFKLQFQGQYLLTWLIKMLMFLKSSANKMSSLLKLLKTMMMQIFKLSILRRTLKILAQKLKNSLLQLHH